MCEDRFKYVAAPGALDIEKMRHDGLYPPDERIAAGPVAVLECAQEIPCNPCEHACRQGCIQIGEDITAMPKLGERCNGCGACVPSCPGLCIFVLNGKHSDTQGTVTFPYEFLPLPKEGEVVDALNRIGAAVCDGTVVRIRTMGKGELCHSVTVAVPKHLLHDIRHIRRRNK